MKSLLIKLHNRFLACQYRAAKAKNVIGNQAVKNNGRNRDARDIAEEFGVPLSVAARFVKVNSAQRALRVIKVLQNNSFAGLSNKELATALDESPANISRTLDVLKNEGFVIKLESGKFAFSSLFAQIAMRHAANMDKASAQINELKQRLGTAAY